MNDTHITLTPKMRAIVRQALYVAEANGAITEDDYRDATDNLRGIYRNPECPGRAFHASAQHFCE